MISVDKAKKILAEQNLHLRQTETLRLEDAYFRILAQDIYAEYDFPAFDNSAMDGFVFHLDDLQTHFDIQKPIPIVGEVAAGDMPIKLPRPHALRIFTGAAVPYGANCVVPVEHCNVAQQAVSIKKEFQHVKDKQHIRPKGLNFVKEECVMKKGMMLNSMNLAVLSSVGLAKVQVYKKLKIAIGVTGDELVPDDLQLPIGKIYDSNTCLLKNLCQNLGFEVSIAKHIPDTLKNTVAFLQDAVEDVDLILTSGGISMGDRDFLKVILQNQRLNNKNKITLHFKNLALKPGKPFAFAHIQNTSKQNIPLLCMPGNPLSVFITYMYFILPYKYNLAGKTNNDVKLEKVKSPKDFLLHSRTQFLFAVKDLRHGITLLHEQGSAAIRNLRDAEGAIIVPANKQISRGDDLDFFNFSQFTHI